MPNQEEEKRLERNKDIRRILWNAIYILLTIGIIVVFGLLDRNVGNFFTQLGSLKAEWVFAAAGVMVLYWISEGEILHFITGFLYKGYSRWKTFKIAMIGVYYSALTPFASGGQPMQVMHMRRDGVPVGKSSSVFCAKFIMFEFVICAFFIISLIFTGTQFFANYQQVFWLTCIGFGINAILALIVILALFSKGKMLLLGTRLIHFLHKIHLVKNPEKRIVSMAESLQDFSISGMLLRSDKKLLIGSGLLTVTQMVVQFSITYCIYRATGLSTHSLFQVISMQAFLYLTVSFVPLPGASVASEGGFYLFFSMFFPSNKMFIAMLIWRFFSYYANIIFGSFFVIYDSIHNLITKRNKLKKAS